MASTPHFPDSLAQLVQELSADVVVPGVDEELQVLADSREGFAPARLLIPDSAFIRTMLDKAAFIAWLESTGLAHPRTSPLQDFSGQIDFPLVIKPRSGRGSRGVVMAEDRLELDAVRLRLTDHLSGYICQERLSGPEYSVQVVADPNGTLRAIVPARIVEKRGITIHAVTEASAEVIDACVNLHAAWPTQGVYNVQGILVEGQGFIPFEINPRVSTTLCLAISAGVDVLEVATGAPGSTTYTAGIELRRFWGNSISNLPLKGGLS
jgi:carbamoyl-phosphate synthase large subunit